MDNGLELRVVVETVSRGGIISARRCLAAGLRVGPTERAVRLARVGVALL